MFYKYIVEIEFVSEKSNVTLSGILDIQEDAAYSFNLELDGVTTYPQI